jgi:hypothetical protein
MSYMGFGRGLPQEIGAEASSVKIATRNFFKLHPHVQVCDVYEVFVANDGDITVLPRRAPFERWNEARQTETCSD